MWKNEHWPYYMYSVMHIYFTAEALSSASSGRAHSHDWTTHPQLEVSFQQPSQIGEVLAPVD